VNSEVHGNGSRGVFLTRVVANQPICPEHWRLTLEVEDFPAAAPGQFVQILCAEPSDLGWSQGVFTRRPFSIAGLVRNGSRSAVDVIHRAVGTGTRWMSRLQPGDAVSLLGPLGKPFEIPAGRGPAWLIGGGVGLPPLIWLARELQARGKPGVAFCGARTAEAMPLTRVPGVKIAGEEPSLCFAEFAESGVPVVTATDDGSLGAAGRIPDAFACYLQKHLEVSTSATIYACGPEPMLRAVARIGLEHKIVTQVCMERVMACGMGTCQSCVVRTHDAAADDGWRYRLCCTDGPVFDAREIVWS
jgi:dihydroorotate dehydrogenase electron transfer subunit